MANRKGRSMHRGYNGGQPRSSGAGPAKPKKPPLTHFLCFPLVSATSRPQLEESLRRFQNLTLSSTISSQFGPESKLQGNHGTAIPTSSQPSLEYGTNGTLPSQPQLPAKAIRPLGTLHLTLGVMSLESEDRVQGAINLLKSLDLVQMIMDNVQQTQENMEDKTALTGTPHHAHPDEAISPSTLHAEQSSLPQGLLCSISPLQTSASQSNPTHDITLAPPYSSPITVSLTSLHSMHNPKSTSILYAAPSDSTNRLLPLGQKLRSIFEENKYMIKDTRPLKLHATVVNTIYARARGRHYSGRQRKPQTLRVAEAADSINSTSTTVTSAAQPVALENLTKDENFVGATVNEWEREEHDEESEPEDCSNSRGRNGRAPIRFDATTLLEQFKDFVWAVDFRVEKVAICKMGAKKVFGERGEVVGEEYEEVAYVELP